MNSSFRDGVQYVWDSTSLKMADACPRYYQYKMIEGWHSERTSFHLRFGMHYATALEHFHKQSALGVPFEEALEAIVLEALMDTWDRTETESGPWTSPHHLKNRENLIRSIVWYLDTFRDEEIKTVILADGKPAVEHSFTLPVDDGLYFAGHLDRLCTFANDPYVMDQKTTGSTLGPYYFNQYSPDMQMSMYTFAGKAIFGLPVKGVIIDAAQIAVGFTRYERGFTFRTDAQLTEWYENTMQLIAETQAQTRAGYFPMRLSSCGNYGGCEFRGVCSRSPDVRKNFLLADFKLGWVWDPLERR